MPSKFLPTCATCKSAIANKVIRCNGRVDIVCVCGFTWQGWGKTNARNAEEMNEFYGDWKDDELWTVMKAMGKSHHCDDNRRIFKGQALYTLWRENDTIDQVRAYTEFRNLVKNI